MADSTSEGSGMGNFLAAAAPALPIVGGVLQNIIEGMNTRKARLYNSPVNQVKRLQEAGLPLAAAGTLTAGGGITTRTADLGTSQSVGNLRSSIQRQIDLKQLALLDAQKREADANARIASGNADNLLNPYGQWINTNQGMTMQNAYSLQQQAVETAKTVNQYLPSEKMLSLEKLGADIDKIAADTKNSLVQNDILISESKIKSILAKYQPDMSKQELENLIKRNTGLTLDNQIKQIAFNVDWNTQQAKITIARNAAINSGQINEAQRLDNVLKLMETDSAKTYYFIKSREDKRVLSHNPNFLRDLIYLGTFGPTHSTYNVGGAVNSGMNMSALLNSIPK